MKRTALILMLLTILSKLLGFFRDLVFSYFYGASKISDAYFISQQIPMSFMEFIGLGLLAGFIPIYTSIEKKYGSIESLNFTNKVIFIMLLISSTVIFFGNLFTDYIVKLFAMGFEGPVLILTLNFTKLSILGIFFLSLEYIFRAFLQVKEEFIIPSLIGIPLSVITIVSILISSKTNSMVLIIGSLFAIVSQVVILVYASYKNGFKFKFTTRVIDENTIDLFKLAVPMMIGISVNQFNVIVDKTLASGIVSGGISALSYASRLNLFVQTIFVLSITTVIYPSLAKFASDDNLVEVKKTLSESIVTILILVTPLTIGAMIFSKEIISLLFARGAFTKDAIIMTSSGLFFYSFGMLGYGLREVLCRVFYSMHDTKTPMINSTIGMIMNIVLSVSLSKHIGIGGLALATSIAANFTTSMLFISLHLKIGTYGLTDIMKKFVKIFISSIVMGVIAFISFTHLVNNFSQNISLILSVIVGVIIYFMGIVIFKIEESMILIELVKRKIKK